MTHHAEFKPTQYRGVEGMLPSLFGAVECLGTSQHLWQPSYCFCSRVATVMKDMIGRFESFLATEIRNMMLLRVGRRRRPSDQSQAGLSTGSHENNVKLKDINYYDDQPTFRQSSSVAPTADRAATISTLTDNQSLPNPTPSGDSGERR
jgi:hypothetical protein